MSSLAIRAEGLSKQYCLGQREQAGRTFREMLAGAVRSPLQRLRRLGGRTDGETFWALRDLSFEVRTGEVVGIIGRNGAGKSTLLKILSRITEPTRGWAEIRGRVASLLEVGTGFHPELTGRENIYLNGAILGMRRAEIRRNFDSIVEFAEIAPFLDTPVKHYSSGMYVRLAFAVAAHLEPEILLIDEVLAVGDLAFQKKCLGKMHDVSRTGRTVLFVSHNMGAVSALCSRAIVLEGGEKAAEAATDEAVRYYLEHNLGGAAMAWTLKYLPRAQPDLGDRVRLERLDALPEASEGFRYGEALRFRIAFRAAASLQRLACALGIDDMYGSRVITFESDRHGATVDTLAGRSYRVEVAVPPFGLLPGNYLLSVSLYSGARYEDYAIHFGTLALHPLAAGTAQYVAPRPGRGAIHQDSVWRIEEVSPEQHEEGHAPPPATIAVERRA